MPGDCSRQAQAPTFPSVLRERKVLRVLAVLLERTAFEREGWRSGREEP